MRYVVARIVYGLAGIALAISLLGLRSTSNEVFHYSTVISGGIPAVVYEPGPKRGWGDTPPEGTSLPAVVLGHGFAGNAQSLSVLARRLVGAGYAVVTPEFRGHGANSNPYTRVPTGMIPGLVDDLEAVVLWTRTRAHYDGERVAVGGHSMGGHAALAYAGRDPALGAVIGISGGAYIEGPYPAPNVFWIWASGDRDKRRAHFRALGAKRAGLQRLVLDRDYGDVLRGTGVRLSEVDGAGHIGIVYRRVTAERIIEWLDKTIGPGQPQYGPYGPPASEGTRLALGALGAAVGLVLIWGLVGTLAPVLPKKELASVGRPFGALGILTGSLAATFLLMAGIDPADPGGPFSFLPFTVARQLFAVFFISGTLMWVWLALRGDINTAGLRDGRTYVGAALIVGASYLILGVVAYPALDLWPATHRVLWCFVGTALALPFFGASEWLLRGAGPGGFLLPALGKLITILAFVLGYWLRLVPPVLALGIAVIVPLFILLEIFAYRISRVTGAPWLVGLYQALWVGWGFVTFFPYEG